MINKILAQMGYDEPLAVTQFKNEEDGEFYNVWRVDYPGQSFVVKQAKGQELENYKKWFSTPAVYAPRLYAVAEDYLLMEYVPGNDLCRCNREDLTLALDSMIRMQEQHWSPANNLIPESRKNRRNYLMDPRLEAAYDAYLKAFTEMPQSLCHDDLLPFNVVISGERAVFIDWEVAGMLPYPTSLARLIAHCEEDENAFFYMANTDKTFAIQYYFEHFIKKMGISREAYDRHIDLCLFHEYCEWVFVGNKYHATDSDRYRQYYQLAIAQATKLGF